MTVPSFQGSYARATARAGTGFTPEIRAAIRAGAQTSAAALAPLLSRELGGVDARPSLIDVGCGEGWFTAEFARLGWHVLGVDHPSTDHPGLSDLQFVAHDLEQPLHPGPWDVALSLEVAEHLTPGRAPSFIHDLCQAAPVVVFSAAIPGQGGTGHVNEQWPGYWSDLFDAEGFVCSGYLRRLVWDNGQIENWYRQNLLIARKAGGTWSTDFWSDSPPRALVHPVLWDHYRALHP